MSRKRKGKSVLGRWRLAALGKIVAALLPRNGTSSPHALLGIACSYRWSSRKAGLETSIRGLGPTLDAGAALPGEGRKGWLFSDTVRGAEASANLCSLIETVEANGLEPYAYLRRVFEELPKAATLAEIELLFPHRIKFGPSPEVKS
jgi:transposase